MENNKSFLDSLSKEIEEKEKEAKKANYSTGENGKPSSFSEEVFQVDTSPSKKKDKKFLIGVGIGTIVLSFAMWYFFFAPKIVMPNLEGQNLNDLGAWAKQYGIQNSSIVVKREYNFDNKEDVIISQDHLPGSKIKKDTPLTFVVSDGADPSEKIAFPDLTMMSQDEIKEWIETNKLTKTKISTQYHDTVEKDQVINYTLKQIDEDEFTRGASLTIVISRGVAPSGEVAVVSYVGKTYEEAKLWADSKKIKVEKQESYSSTVEAGKIISQSVEAGKVMKEGETLLVVVSKGEAITMPSLVGYTEDMLEAWVQGQKEIFVVTKEVYHTEPKGTVVEQSISAGTIVEAGTVVTITKSLYMPQLMTNSHQWLGRDYLELLDWVDETNAKGARLSAGAWMGEICPEDESYTTSGQIVEMSCMDNAGNQLPYAENGCARPLPIDAKISMKIVAKGCPVRTPISE